MRYDKKYDGIRQGRSSAGKAHAHGRDEIGKSPIHGAGYQDAKECMEKLLKWLSE